jgi:hypothetical protein
MKKEVLFNEGELVGVPCTSQPGPFPDERLIAVETHDGLLSGFVKQDHLHVADDRVFVMGVVLEARDDSIAVKLFGSFFTTAAGLAFVRRHGLTRIAA